MADESKSIHQLLQWVKLEKDDIEEIVDPDVGQEGAYSIVRVKEESRPKYGGHANVAAALKRLSSSPYKLQEGVFKEMRKAGIYREGIVFMSASDEAVDFIKQAVG